MCNSPSNRLSLSIVDTVTPNSRRWCIELKSHSYAHRFCSRIFEMLLRPYTTKPLPNVYCQQNETNQHLCIVVDEYTDHSV